MKISETLFKLYPTCYEQFQSNFVTLVTIISEFNLAEHFQIFAHLQEYVLHLWGF